MIGRPLFSSFILTLGLLAILNSVILIVWGPETVAFAKAFPSGSINLGGIILAKEYVWAFCVSAVAVAAFAFFFQRTKLGLAIRAAYDNQIAARCLGVSARLNSQIAWALCALFATIGGILIASVQGVSVFLSELVMVVLAVVFLGGLDSLIGCMVGGLVLAIGVNLAGYYLNPYVPGIGSVFGLIVILLVLLIRPSGLFGTKPVERV